MSEFRADLHCHSTCSDGTTSPIELVKMAVEKGLSGLSITDHDTLDAYKTAAPLAQELEIELIPGVEFSAMQGNVSIHLLAYAFPLESSILHDFCLKHKHRRQDRNREILKKLTEKGMPLTEEEVLADMFPNLPSTIGRPHIALAMLKRGYIQTIQEGFNKFLGEGKSCYAEGKSFSVQETLDKIHQANGLAIIAHPHLINDAKTLKQLLEMNFDGIECFYARFPKESHERWVKIAKHRNWLITGGSDFHGEIKPNISLGSSWVDETHFLPLKQHFNQVSGNKEERPYQSLLKKLFSVNLHGGMKLGLSHIEKLNDLLGNPLNSFKSVHVAGSNGKGSVVTKISRGLEAEGYRVGLFTSPHISTFRERIKVNGQLIDEKSVTHLLQKIFHLVEKENIPATFFEITTALALAYFAQQKVDYVVLETGLGGRLDATNIVMPILSIITSISLEHTEYLGNTIEEIAKEKAGIIKPAVPVIIGPCVPKNIIEKIAEENKSPCVQVTGNFTFFDDENNAVAKKAMQMLGLSELSIQAGLKALPPCRMELVSQNPPVILDVGHNPDGLQHLFQAARQNYPKASFRVLFGVSKNKDIEGCLNVLKKYGSQFHLVEAQNGRGLEVSELYKKMLDHGFSQTVLIRNGSIKESIQHALKSAKLQNQILIVCGTFFIMSEARQALGIREPKDGFDLNEKMK